MSHEGLFRRNPLQDENKNADKASNPKLYGSKKSDDTPSKDVNKDVA